MVHKATPVFRMPGWGDYEVKGRIRIRIVPILEIAKLAAEVATMGRSRHHRNVARAGLDRTSFVGACRRCYAAAGQIPMLHSN